jgi:hypothetical protein
MLAHLADDLDATASPSFSRETSGRCAMSSPDRSGTATCFSQRSRRGRFQPQALRRSRSRSRASRRRRERGSRARRAVYHHALGAHAQAGVGVLLDQTFPSSAGTVTRRGGGHERAAVMSDWRRSSCGAAMRRRSSRSGGSRVEKLGKDEGRGLSPLGRESDVSQ